MNELKINGGAVIGRATAKWPLATLTVEANVLVVNATIFGKFVFTRDDIISFEPFMSRTGIQINHNVAWYNKKIVFLSSKSPSQLGEAIQ